MIPRIAPPEYFEYIKDPARREMGCEMVRLWLASQMKNSAIGTRFVAPNLETGEPEWFEKRSTLQILTLNKL